MWQRMQEPAYAEQMPVAQATLDAELSGRTHGRSSPPRTCEWRLKTDFRAEGRSEADAAVARRSSPVKSEGCKENPTNIDGGIAATRMPAR
ncbi:hypothetical protein BKP42_63130 [Rhodococcus erythropolis]|nr:hypothetical protein BKP42_63130 [Rhodococcus erythropolis]